MSVEAATIEEPVIVDSPAAEETTPAVVEQTPAAEEPVPATAPVEEPKVEETPAPVETPVEAEKPAEVETPAEPEAPVLVDTPAVSVRLVRVISVVPFIVGLIIWVSFYNMRLTVCYAETNFEA